MYTIPVRFASNASGEAKDVARTLSFLCMVLCKGEPPCNVQKVRLCMYVCVRVECTSLEFRSDVLCISVCM